MRFFTVLLFLQFIFSAYLAAQDFVLKTYETGLFLVSKTNGVAVADYDLDGDLDIYFVAIQQYDPEDETTWNRLFRNNGDGTFSDVTVEAGVLSKVNGHSWSAMGNKFGAAWGDYDNDGYSDLFLTNVGENELYHNQGDGTFINVTEPAGVVGDSTNHNSSAVWWDYDLDGDLDLYISAWIGLNRMYENIGDGTFLDVTESTALGDSGRTWTSLPFDGNNDGLLDLYVVNDFGANKFYVNLGNKSFGEATAEFGLEDAGHGMGVTLGDYDNNGFFDIYLTNIEGLNPATPNPLFTNTGHSYFINKSTLLGVSEAGWAWGTEFFDCDHDGDQDLYVVNGFKIEPGKNYFFLNALDVGRATFPNKSVQSGTDGEAEARGLIVFDYDDDGDLDLLVSNFREQPYLYENQTVSKNWLKIKLEGTHSNRNAFGAIVRVSANGKTCHRNHDGVDFLGQSIKPLHFGLGEALMAEEIVVQWPNGTEEKIFDVSVNQTIKIKEGLGLITGVQSTSSFSAPKEFQLLGNFPNPFNGSTVIEFALPQKGTVRVIISNLLGQEVKTIRETFLKPGRHRILWDGTNQSGNFMSSGFYMYRIVYQNFYQTGKMLYLR